MDYRNRQVVVTGGTGALGTAVVGALIKAALSSARSMSATSLTWAWSRTGKRAATWSIR